MKPIINLAFLVTIVALCLTANAETGKPTTYPAAIYPTPSRLSLRQSEVSFTEDDNSRRFGFDKPFPADARKTFRVDDYGAKPNGTTDCTPAFYDALAAAIAFGGPSEILFASPGRYYFRPNPARGSDEYNILNVRHATNLLIRGQGPGTVLLSGDPALGLLTIAQSNTVMIRDFAIDYSPLPFTQGTIISVKDGGFTLRIHDGYPTPDAMEAAIPGQHSGFKVLQAGNGAYKWLPIGGVLIKSTQQVEGPNWRFKTDPPTLADSLSPGEEFVYVGRRIGEQALSVRWVRGFYLKDVAVHASPTCGFGIGNVDGCLIDGYADCVPAGSTRLLASNADGIWNGGVRGGFTIKNSYFMGQGDDCINLHCPAIYSSHVTTSKDDATQIVFGCDLMLQPGDRLEVMNPSTNQYKGEVTITAADVDIDGRKTRCRLSAPLASIGYDPKTDYVYPVALAVPSFKIVHNYFGQNRSRALIIQARGGLIQGNTFENADGYGVILGYGGSAWPEGVIPANVTIRDNVFRNVTGTNMTTTIEATGTSGRYLRNLVVENNRFINPRKIVLAANGCSGVKFIGNKVSTAHGLRNTWNHPQWYTVDCSISLWDCTGVVVDRFDIQDPDLKECVIYVNKECDAGKAGVVVTGVKAKTSAGVPIMKDDR